MALMRTLLQPLRSFVLPQSQIFPAVTAPAAFWGCNHQQLRFKRKNNRNPLKKWRGFRRLKVIKVKLPDYEEYDRTKNLTPDEMRTKMKQKGISPGRPWMERPFEISATGDVFEGYIPPEGDGRASFISKEGAKQSAEMVSKKSKSWLAFRKIRQYDEDFTHQHFLREAQEIYLNVHKAVMAYDRHLIRTLVTERMYPEVMHNLRYKTIHWKFLESVEPPSVVHARCTDVISKENVFAQITCRFFTKQILAVYDRFGRLSHGSEVIAKDVLEYVVFEKHLANEYGIWRIHAKIVPPWLNNEIDTPRTYVASSASASNP